MYIPTLGALLLSTVLSCSTLEDDFYEKPEVQAKMEYLDIFPDIMTHSHRGDLAGNNCQENTMSAFYDFMLRGGGMLETDLQWTKDGEIVLSHNQVLTGYVDSLNQKASPLIANLTIQELRKNYRTSGGWHEPIPTLRELARFCKRTGIPVNLDKVTSLSQVQEVAKVCIEEGYYDFGITIWPGSDCLKIIDYLHSVAPRAYCVIQKTVDYNSIINTVSAIDGSTRNTPYNSFNTTDQPELAEKILKAGCSVRGPIDKGKINATYAMGAIMSTGSDDSPANTNGRKGHVASSQLRSWNSDFESNTPMNNASIELSDTTYVRTKFDFHRNTTFDVCLRVVYSGALSINQGGSSSYVECPFGEKITYLYTNTIKSGSNPNVTIRPLVTGTVLHSVEAIIVPCIDVAKTMNYDDFYKTYLR